MNVGFRARRTVSAIALAAGIAGFSTSCVEEIECGEGTVQMGSACVPLQAANCTGDGVRFVDGRCVADPASFCGPGTALSEDGTRCVSTGANVDLGTPDTGLPDVGVADTLDDGLADLVDLETGEGPFVPTCGNDLEAGSRICLWGRLLDFVSLTPVTGDADPDLEVQAKHLLSAQSDPTVEALGQAIVRNDGNFIIPAFDIPGDGALNTLLLIAGEVEESAPEGPGSVWQRTLGGLITIPESGTTTEFGEQALFTVRRSAVAEWNEEAGLSGGEVLEATGFQLLRVVDADQRPIQGATVTYEGDGETVRYFQDAAMTRFRGPSNRTTGPSGAVLVTGVEGDNCTAEASGMIAVQSAVCQVSPGRLSVGVIVMIPAS